MQFPCGIVRRWTRESNSVQAKKKGGPIWSALSQVVRMRRSLSHTPNNFDSIARFQNWIWCFPVLNRADVVFTGHQISAGVPARDSCVQLRSPSYTAGGQERLGQRHAFAKFFFTGGYLVTSEYNISAIQ